MEHLDCDGTVIGIGSNITVIKDHIGRELAGCTGRVVDFRETPFNEAGYLSYIGVDFSESMGPSDWAPNGLWDMDGIIDTDSGVYLPSILMRVEDNVELI